MKEKPVFLEKVKQPFTGSSICFYLYKETFTEDHHQQEAKQKSIFVRLFFAENIGRINQQTSYLAAIIITNNAATKLHFQHQEVLPEDPTKLQVFVFRGLPKASQNPSS